MSLFGISGDDDTVVNLPRKTLPHAFTDSVTVAADPKRGRYSQTERECVLCGIIKITVHGPSNSFRMWRRPGDAEQFESRAVPPCTPASGDVLDKARAE